MAWSWVGSVTVFPPGAVLRVCGGVGPLMICQSMLLSAQITAVQLRHLSTCQSKDGCCLMGRVMDSRVIPGVSSETC